MTISLTGFVILLVIAGVCGAIGRAIAGDIRGGIIVSIALGFIGAFLGVWLAGVLHLPELFVIQVEGHPFPIVWSVIGAAVFVALLSIFTRRPRRAW